MNFNTTKFQDKKTPCLLFLFHRKCFSVLFNSIILKFACVLYHFQALTHFNEQMTKNSQLRKEVQTFHMEHLRFQQLRDRLQKVRGHTTNALGPIYMTIFLR